MFEQFQTPNYATFWHRFAAALIDGLLLLVIYCPLALVLGVVGAVAEQSGEGAQVASVAGQVLFQLFTLVTGWLYSALLESSSWQATVGKKVLGIRVTDLEGRRIGFGRATGRHFGKIISQMICFIGFIMAAFTERRQALHDMIAGTLVLQGPPGSDLGTGYTINQPPPPPPSNFGYGG